MDIGADEMEIRVLVVPTDEELKIARETRAVIEGSQAARKEVPE
jgi:acetate kinase